MYTVIDTDLATNALHFISDVIGFLLIWYAINYKRNKHCMIEDYTKDWFILLIIVITAALFFR